MGMDNSLHILPSGQWSDVPEGYWILLMCKCRVVCRRGPAGGLRGQAVPVPSHLYLCGALSQLFGGCFIFVSLGRCRINLSAHKCFVENPVGSPYRVLLLCALHSPYRCRVH